VRHVGRAPGACLQEKINLAQPFHEGRIPGYLGFVPGSKNHSIGKTFKQAAIAGVSARFARNLT